ncbi:MAG TPA: lysophospholipid acyltransferase family protein [Bryobacteraceae bacterium]|nr:lysophospholipid acyltransferase family protein [Bryobacteraceae bacterium]
MRSGRLGHAWSLVFTVPIALTITGLMILLAVIHSSIDRQDRVGLGWARAWSRIVLGFIGVRVSAAGGQAIAAGDSYVFVSNHASLIDIPVLVGAIPAHLRFMAKRELMRVPFIGWWLRHDGHLPVDRADPRAAMRSLLEAADAVRRRGLSVVVFAEGSRSRSGIQPFKDGAALLAIRAGVPVVPVAVRGTDRVLPAKSSWLRGGDVRVRIGDPIPTAGLDSKDRRRLTGAVEAEVRRLYGESGRELLAASGAALEK